jgi:hypothetical protein
MHPMPNLSHWGMEDCNRHPLNPAQGAHHRIWLRWRGGNASARLLVPGLQILGLAAGYQHAFALVIKGARGSFAVDGDAGVLGGGPHASACSQVTMGPGACCGAGRGTLFLSRCCQTSQPACTP